MIDIVERLRRLAEPRFSSYPIADLLAEAADEIEQLRSENLALDHERNIWMQEVINF